ncbi:response regulator [Paenibacillus radicis (ex Gao et al. 2016)]|uniref:DNA-binding response regulator n=1 Tax=Paenibacillus radicis (ex Gao et al. 2016) TaxID=1737354 RepID=A0A917M9B9_9BACL|nr:response regulator [Paenibacillus radicis (ex Gao et al. 2016)]GGG85697.1 DNA-binding response regulator [Paenibacillus radicis (ex Gao et al. 2016)]
MYKVLIAEDEMWVRLGLKNSINWENLGMTVAGDVANGVEAWEHYQKDKPDIVITDIRMPEMDGMELIDRIREHDAATKIIILTCLEEFGLIQTAMRNGVSDFILKLTMESNEMVNILAKVKQELDEERADSSKHLLRDIDVLKESFVKDYLFRNRYSQEEFLRYVSEYKLMLDPHNIRICLMDIHHYHRLKVRFGDERGQLLRMSMLNVLQEILRDYGCGEVCHDADNRYLFLLSFGNSLSENEQFQQLHQLLDHIRRVMRSYFNIAVTFAVSSTAHDLSPLRAMYRECLHAMSYKLYVNTDHFICGDVNLQLKAEEKIHTSLAGLAEVLSLHGEQLSKEFSHWSERMKERELPESREATVRDFNYLFHRLSLHVPHQSQESAELVTQCTLRLESCETWDEMVQLAETFIQGLMQTRQIPMSRKVAEAVAYINRNFQGELTLQDVADVVGVSPNYLSSLLKKELDVNFSEYLIHIRVEKAKRLLLESDLRSYEVADHVGFMDHSHFSRTFKKSTGMGPREFRKRWGQVEEISDDE